MTWLQRYQLRSVCPLVLVAAAGLAIVAVLDCRAADPMA